MPVLARSVRRSESDHAASSHGDTTVSSVSLECATRAPGATDSRSDSRTVACACADRRVVDPSKLETLPLGTVCFCTAADLRDVATLMESGATEEQIATALWPQRRRKGTPANEHARRQAAEPEPAPVYSASHIAGRMTHELESLGSERAISAAAVHAIMRGAQTPSTLNRYPWPDAEQQQRIREMSDNPRGVPAKS